MNNITYEQFRLIDFRTVHLPMADEESAASSSEGQESSSSFTNGVLAIMNSEKVGALFIKFIDSVGQVSYCESNIQVGSSLSLGNAADDVKATRISLEELSKMEISVAQIVNCVVQRCPFGGLFFTAEVDLDMGGGVREKCWIPHVCDDGSLEGKKIVVLPNLPQQQGLGPKVHALCGIRTPSNGFWYPFFATNPDIAVGTRAVFEEILVP